jgi:hypothetical protein
MAVVILLVVLTLLLLFLALQQERADLALLAALPAGAAMLLRAVNVIAKRYDIQHDPEFPNDKIIYSGEAAVFRGMMGVIFSVLVMGAGVLPLFDVHDIVIDFVTHTPGALLMLGGGFMLLILLPGLAPADNDRGGQIVTMVFIVASIAAIVTGQEQMNSADTQRFLEQLIQGIREALQP